MTSFREGPRVDRIIVMVKDEVGVIAAITGVLAGAGVNLRSINTETTGETGLVIITADNTDEALRVLTDAGYRAVIDDVLVVRLPDEPGALAKVAEKFKRAGVNIQSLHILDRHGGYTTVALTADDRTLAEQLIGQDSIV